MGAPPRADSVRALAGAGTDHKGVGQRNIVIFETRYNAFPGRLERARQVSFGGVAVVTARRRGGIMGAAPFAAGATAFVKCELASA